MIFKKMTLALALSLGLGAAAEIRQVPYSESAVATAEKAGKVVVLGFHKKGCGTCTAQEEALVRTGFDRLTNVEFFRVERKDDAMTSVYEKFGLGKRQWAALVMLKNGKEVARVEPGTTDEQKIKEFVAKAN